MNLLRLEVYNNDADIKQMAPRPPSLRTDLQTAPALQNVEGDTAQLSTASSQKGHGSSTASKRGYASNEARPADSEIPANRKTDSPADKATKIRTTDDTTHHIADPITDQITDPITDRETDHEATVVLHGVNKRFGDVEAINDLDLLIPKAQISVLLGPNGAGKTTAIRLITGALTPDTGTATVFGLDPTGSDGEEVRRRCGVVTAKPSLYDRLSGQDNLQYAADLYGLGKTDAPKRISEAAEQFDIVDALGQQVGGYSTGMKTRLALARAVLHRPDLLLLDEPTSGLDPESAHSVLSMVRDMTSDGKTVLMCTHLLLEAEGLADQIIILQNGSNLLSGIPDQLAAGYWPNRIVQIRTPRGADLDRLSDRLGTISYSRESNTAKVELSPTTRIGDLVADLVAGGVSLDAVIPFEPTLEDLYLRIRREYQLGAHANRPSEPPQQQPSRTTSEADTARVLQS